MCELDKNAIQQVTGAGSMEARERDSSDETRTPDIDKTLLEACIEWDGNTPLESIEDLRAWAKKSEKNLFVVKAIEALLRVIREKGGASPTDTT